MPVNLVCPHCGKTLAVPTKKVGGVVNCPKCSGQFMAMPAPSGNESSDSSVPHAHLPTPQPEHSDHEGPVVQGPTAHMHGPSTSSSQVRAVPSPMPGAIGPRAVPAPAPQHSLSPKASPIPMPTSGSAIVPKKNFSKENVARFVTNTAMSTVALASDGKLPELKLSEAKLSEGGSKGVSPAGQRDATPNSNPLVLVGVIGFSLMMSVFLLVMDVGSGSGSNAAERKEARKELADFYGDLDEDVKPYQQHLRLAQQAYTRRDMNEERKQYRIVLQLLRSENLDPYNGLTGSLKKDEDLLGYLSKVLDR